MDGYQIPLDFHNGLPYLQCRSPTQSDLDTLPYVIMTSDLDWDPSSYDNVIDDLHPFYDAKINDISDSNFDARGNYRHRTIATHTLHGESEFFFFF